MQTVSLGMILEARERLKHAVRRTDLVPSKVLDIPGKREVFLKTECLQYTGSFKLRGAYNRVALLTPEERACGVIASSAGNHAQGVAMAAQKFGIKATIVMPKGAPLAKVAATRSYGAEVVLHGVVYDDAYAEACRIQQETGAVFIHPFNDPYVIAGQGSIGLEIMDANPEIDTVVVPIGGGGMASGIAAAIKLLHPHVKVVGVEAAGAASMLMSMHNGQLSTLTSASTMYAAACRMSPTRWHSAMEPRRSTRTAMSITKGCTQASSRLHCIIARSLPVARSRNTLKYVVESVEAIVKAAYTNRYRTNGVPSRS